VILTIAAAAVSHRAKDGRDGPSWRLVMVDDAFLTKGTGAYVAPYVQTRRELSLSSNKVSKKFGGVKAVQGGHSPFLSRRANGSTP